MTPPKQIALALGIRHPLGVYLPSDDEKFKHGAMAHTVNIWALRGKQYRCNQRDGYVQIGGGSEQNL